MIVRNQPVRKYQLILALLSCVGLFVCNNARAQTDQAEKKEWHGYEQSHFRIADRAAWVVAPKKSLPGNPWIWRARFPGYHDEMDVQLVGKGFHLAYVDVANLFGAPKAIEIGDQFYKHMTEEMGLSKTPALEGVSRGGLFVYNWAVKNTDKVSCIYCDTPVCDFKSWPRGEGVSVGHLASWKACLAAYELTEEQAQEFKGNPVDHAPQIAAARIPIMHIVSRNDKIVPPAANTDVLKNRFDENAVENAPKMQIINVAEGTKKSNGHHFDHTEVDRVVEFIFENGQR